MIYLKTAIYKTFDNSKHSNVLNQFPLLHNDKSERLQHSNICEVILKQMLKAKVLIIITFISFTLSIIWLQLVTTPDSMAGNKDIIQEAIQNITQDSLFPESHRKTSRLPKGLKYLLLWTDHNVAPLHFFRKGQEKFLEKNCPLINCYVTNDRNFFNGDLTKFHALAFNGRSLDPADLPKQRSPHQKYIYFNMESADMYPVCHKAFDNFFNWTATYKLNSDILFQYILIRRNGKIVGPKSGMEWLKETSVVSDKFTKKLVTKSKAAAWFVSHCETRSKREKVVQQLQKALAPYDHTIDIYGKCGPLKCPRVKKDDCNKMLERDYFFYLSFENSFSEDYVTEKLLTALQHNAVPIVYGGCNYTRFLPPGSYLDARKLSPNELAATMDKIMKSPSLYQQFFSWKDIYTYSDPSVTEDVCNVCDALNDKKKFEKRTVYKHFRSWWNPNYKKRCLSKI